MPSHPDNSYVNTSYGQSQTVEVSEASIKEYWIQFRERIGWFLAVFILCFAGSVIYTLNVRPVYTASATVEILRDDPDIMGAGASKDLAMQKVLNSEDFRTQINILESGSIIRAVASRLKDNELEQFMSPYQNVIRLEGPYTPEEVLGFNRSIVPIRQSLTVVVNYTHPDKNTAAKLANLFVDEFIERNVRLLVSTSIGAVDLLKIRSDQTREQVDKLERALADYREKHDIVSFDERADIDHQELKTLSDNLTKSKSVLDEVQSQWEMLDNYRKQGRDLWDLPFIGSMSQVSELLTKLSTYKIEIASLSQRYREKHPRMIQSQQGLKQTANELRATVDSAAEKIKSIYSTAHENHKAALDRLKKKELSILEMGKIRVNYNSIQRDLDVAKSLYQGILQRMEVETAQVDMKKPNARVIDRAYPPNHFSSPNHKVNVAIGFFGGVGCGFALVFMLAFIDDRVKSTIDVEGDLQLNLLCLIPKSKKMDSFKRARIAETNDDLRIAEAFRSLYSTIRISDVGRHSQVILMTSTLPSEGKSFVATNLALTFAAHGERTLLIDADLRMPAIAQSLRLEKQVKETGGGLVGYFEGESTWETMIVPQIVPQLDLLASVRRAKTPSEIVNSTHFIDIVNVLRERYDRIIVDSPPLGIVSDALGLVPAVDACLYVIKHKGVKRRNIKTSVRRLVDAHMPMLGAVMNQVDKSAAGYYHSYYDKGGHKYYGGYEKKKASKSQTAQA